MIVRPAAPEDSAVIVELLGELGYPATAQEVGGRKERLAAFPNTVTLVAEADGRVVGVATGQLFPSIHVTPITAWLTTLVVSSRHHSRGIGRQLVKAIEDWARAGGAVRISLTSGTQRVGAHTFYERLGYERTGVRLTRSLA